MKEFSIGAYYFPGYHCDPRNDARHGRGWTEWNLVRQATPRFAGHVQPLVPAWGYEDEADPVAMARKIDAAADHGLDFWIFDWYWYDNKPFLNRCLDEGFLKAPNSRRMQFCLMWANHDWIDLHPHKKNGRGETLFQGKVTTDIFNTITDHVVQVYFRHPGYYKIGGRPYYSFYDLGKLVESFGSVPATRAALDRFRQKARAAGFPDLHLNAVAWGQPILPGETTPANTAELVRGLGFDSVTSYVWVHHVDLDQSPYTPYTTVRDRYNTYWDTTRAMFMIPYFPNVTMGWDSTPRTVQSDVWEPVGYPYTNLLGGNTPEQFRHALAIAKARMAGAKTKIMTINAWNEWTEGSYLEPDSINGMRYLEAIRDVFGVPKL